MPAKVDISTSQVRLFDFLTGHGQWSVEVAEVRQSANIRRSCRAMSMQHSAGEGKTAVCRNVESNQSRQVPRINILDPTSRQSVDHNKSGVMDLKRFIGDKCPLKVFLSRHPSQVILTGATPSQ